MFSNRKTTEREFAIRLIGWLNEFLSQGNYPFETATGETSITVADKKHRFPDVQIWFNRKAGLGFCGWELKTPETPSDDTGLLANAAEKARAMNAAYFVTWNMQKAIIWRMPLAGASITVEYRLKTYPIISQVSTADDLQVASKAILLKNLAKNILDDLAKLHQDGHLYEKDTDTTFFIKLLSDAVSQLSPLLSDALRSKASERQFQKGLEEWAFKQGISNFGAEEFYDSVSRQLVYRTLGKIILYQALRRFKQELPKLDLNMVTPGKVTGKLNEFFEAARQIDYQAVFEKGYTDEVGIPPKAAPVLTELINKLNQYNFSGMPVDVIGQVFEELIPPTERHNLGQYFTREDLVDLINTFCIRGAKDSILDPTCGSGTFLTRAYNRLLQLGGHDHKKLLTQLWGIDIAHFPTELATINLYRQNLNDYANFPRVIRQDFFEVKPGQIFKFPPPKADVNIPHIDQQIPQFDGIIGNFPYIRQELIEKVDKTYKSKLTRVHQDDWIKDYPDFFDKNHSPKLSGQADIYASLFLHTARFLKEDGRMGIVTSNAWLDVEYGYELQKFFLKHFKIIAILESRCEPWFEDAAVNTIVTILERCTKAEERNRHIVKFVKLKKPLNQLIPWDIKDPVNRWSGLQRLVGKIEHIGQEYYKPERSGVPMNIGNNKIINTLKGIKTVEDENFRIRISKQEDLLDEVAKSGKTVKWGRYLRAPEIYFEIMDKCKGKLVPLKQVADIRFGLKTGINEFFYLTEEQIKHWGIEKEFLKPVIKSPKEAKGILLKSGDVECKVFLCHETKSKLRKRNRLNALQYIEWGEKQKTKDGIVWPNVESVSGRKLWYDLGEREPGKILLQMITNDRFFSPYNTDGVQVDHNLFELFPNEANYSYGLGIYFNSTIVAL
ncbi:MAG: SAM-dependent DNA methyltransferase [Planctomycetes bacterium]|nr:SAM-dependent DNA methyltransferase [Planctomycetota bacterium]